VYSGWFRKDNNARQYRSNSLDWEREKTVKRKLRKKGRVNVGDEWFEKYKQKQKLILEHNFHQYFVQPS